MSDRHKTISCEITGVHSAFTLLLFSILLYDKTCLLWFIFTEEEDVLAPPGTEAPPLKLPDVEKPSERTVIAPKRTYNSSHGPGQDTSNQFGGPNRYNQGNHFGQNRYGLPPTKKPFDYNRVGGMSVWHVQDWLINLKDKAHSIRVFNSYSAILKLLTSANIDKSQ